MRRFVKPLLVAIFLLFLLPLAGRATLFAVEERPRSWREASWVSSGLLPDASAEPQARVIVFAGRTGGWKGLFAVHSWIVVKAAGAPRWTRYDVVGWGRPVRVNGWAADGRWYGNVPEVVADITGAPAAAIIPRIEAAIAEYPFNDYGAYRIWPGPNSNTFVATVLRAVPDLAVALPPEAIGKDFRPEGFYFGLTDSGTGIELSLWGALGFKIGWVEGVELNFLGLVAGLDLRRPGIKIPGFGRIGV